jgi:hypothetical protein
MNILFIIIGLIIMILTFKNVFQINNDVLLSKDVNKKIIVKFEDELDNIHNSINNLSDKLDDICDFLSSDGFLEQEFKNNKNNKTDFAEIFEKHIDKREYDAVYKEYMRGASLTELARKFNREKGEIQLILSLKK